MRKECAFFPAKTSLLPRALTLILILLLPAVMLSGCAKAEAPREMNYEFYYLADYWDAYDLSHSAIPNQEIFEALAVQYTSKIEALLDIHDWWAETNPNTDTIGINAQVGNGGSWSYPPAKISEDTVEITVILDLDSLKNRYGYDGALAHELTHTIAGASFSQSLEEGLCDYVQTQIGTNPYRLKPEWNKCEIWKLNVNVIRQTGAVSTDKLAEIQNYVGAAGGYPYGITTLNGALWYRYSEVFVTYLIDTYGLDKTVALIREGTDESSYETYLGTTYEEIKQNWAAWFDALAPSMTLEEVTEIEERYMEGFGYSS